MSLYWKDLEIIPGMKLEVELYRPEVFDSDGKPAIVEWKILSFGSRKSDEAYLDYSTGKKYPLNKVIKKKRLQARLNQGLLLQLPPCSDYMVVQEYHNGKGIRKRCYNLDMLQTIRKVRVVE